MVWCGAHPRHLPLPRCRPAPQMVPQSQRGRRSNDGAGKSEAAARPRPSDSSGSCGAGAGATVRGMRATRGCAPQSARRACPGFAGPRFPVHHRSPAPGPPPPARAGRRAAAGRAVRPARPSARCSAAPTSLGGRERDGGAQPRQARDGVVWARILWCTSSTDLEQGCAVTAALPEPFGA